MTKSFFLHLLLCGALAFSSAIAYGKSQQLIIGYGNGDLETDVEMGEPNYPIFLRQAVEFPAGYMKTLAGNRITRVRLPLAMMPSEQDNELFLSHDLSGEPFYTQTIEQLNEGWNEVVLSEPYEITGEGEDLFVGFSIKSKGMIISFDGEEEDNDLSDYMAFSQTDGDYASWSWYHETGGNLNIQAVVEGENLPQNAASIKSLRVGKCQPTGRPIAVDVVVRNMGAETINSLSISCGFKDETTRMEVGNLEIPSNGYRLITLDGFSVDANAIGTLTVSVDEVNGQENTSDSRSKETGNLIFNSDYARHYILLEQFSSEYCANCPTGHATLARNTAKYSNVIWVTHHSGFADDSFTIPESGEYLKLFGSEGSYNPAMMVNRSDLSQYGAGTSASPVVEPDRDTAPVIFSGMNDVPAYVDLDLNVDYDKAARSLDVSVDASVPSGNADRIDGDRVSLFVFLVENGLVGRQLNNRSEFIENYRHDNVVRHIMTATWGDKVEFDGEGKYSSDDYSYTLPAEWNAANMRVVAFIANSDQTTPSNNAVFNAVQKSVTEDAAGVENNVTSDAEPGFLIAGDVLTTGIESEISIFTMSGVQVIKSVNSRAVDISALPRGAYIVRIANAKECRSAKFIR